MGQQLETICRRIEDGGRIECCRALDLDLIYAGEERQVQSLC